MCVHRGKAARGRETQRQTTGTWQAGDLECWWIRRRDEPRWLGLGSRHYLHLVDTMLHLRALYVQSCCCFQACQPRWILLIGELIYVEITEQAGT